MPKLEQIVTVFGVQAQGPFIDTYRIVCRNDENKMFCKGTVRLKQYTKISHLYRFANKAWIVYAKA